MAGRYVTRGGMVKCKVLHRKLIAKVGY